VTVASICFGDRTERAGSSYGGATRKLGAGLRPAVSVTSYSIMKWRPCSLRKPLCRGSRRQGWKTGRLPMNDQDWHWAPDVHRHFQEIGISQAAYVPDGGLARLIELCNADETIRSVVLTTEEEGVAQIAGAWLGGERGVFLTQSGGVGNCINMFSMIAECRIPSFAMVSMRGQWGETIPWQVPMGQATAAALEAAGVIVQTAWDPREVPEMVQAATRLAFDAGRAVAVVISQRITGTGERG